MTARLRVERDAARAQAEALAEELNKLTITLTPWLTTADAGLPAIVKTIGDSSDLHNAQRAARAALAAYRAANPETKPQ